MRYINDTCIFLHKINNPDNFFSIVNHLNKANEILCITDVVLEELNPGIFISEDDSKKSKELYNSIEMYKERQYVEFIEISKNGKHKLNYESIRKRYYGHLTDKNELKKLVDSGKYTAEEAKRLQYKDRGECSCLAVAMENPEYYIIVSDDKGLVTLRPDTNIFKIFQMKHKVKVYHYETWLEEIRYKTPYKNKRY